MKNILIGIGIGVVSTLLLAATPAASFLTIKPAQPVATVAYYGSAPQAFTTKYAQAGYQIITSAAGGHYDFYVVMVKY